MRKTKKLWMLAAILDVRGLFLAILIWTRNIKKNNPFSLTKRIILYLCSI